MPTTRTVRIVVRHSSDCKDRRKGPEWKKCGCRKSLLVYDGTSKATFHKSCKTRSWEKAEDFKREYEDSFDPEKQELKRLRAADEKKQKHIEEAVRLYLTDMIARLGDNGTVAGARHLLEDSLSGWLATQVPRPIHISEITPDHLIAWRHSWKLGDLTAAVRWSGVRSFFNFCEGQGWVSDSPARRIRATKVSRKGRTGVFSDEQLTAILNAARRDQRTLAFIELMRWGGMAITDAVLFQPEMIDAEGVLKYRRHKTDEFAVVPLPEHVLVDLRGVPLEKDSAGPAQPFRTKDTQIKSDVRAWQRVLKGIFDAAKITQVQTEAGADKPHSHCFRDSFAVWNLRHGVTIYAVAKMLGHSSVKTTERSYLPWVPELQAAHIAEARRVLVHAKPKSGKLGVITLLSR